MKFIYKKIGADIALTDSQIERRINCTTGNQSRKITTIIFSTYIF
jgi:hypothetical protein